MEPTKSFSSSHYDERLVLKQDQAKLFQVVTHTGVNTPVGLCFLCYGLLDLAYNLGFRPLTYNTILGCY
jgi:hypothetical protein